MQDVGHMYDMLYSVYCAKLGVEGQEYSVEQALRESVDEGRRVKEESSSFGSKKKAKKNNTEETILWWVVFAISVIAVLIYYIILCFTFFDRNKETEAYMIKEAKRKKDRKAR